MKRLVYQVSVGKPPPFYKVCIDSVAKYCERYGFEHVVQTEPTIRLRPVNSHRSEMAVERYGYLPHFEKANMFNRLDDFDQIAYIDADIFVRDCAPNIFEEIDSNTTIAGVRECDLPLTKEFRRKTREYSQGQYGMLAEMKALNGPKGIPYYNSGVLVMNTQSIKPYLKGETADEFVRRKEFEGFVNGEGKWKWASDQTPLNWWFIKEKMNIKQLDWKWNALYSALTEPMTKAYFVHFFLASKLQKKGVDIVKLIKEVK